MRDWWKPYDGTIVGYVVKTNKGKYMPCLGRCVPDYSETPDDAEDCVLSPIGKGPKHETVEEALAFFTDNPPGVEVKEVFQKPISPGMMGMSWLIEPYIATYGNDPRKTVN